MTNRTIRTPSSINERPFEILASWLEADMIRENPQTGLEEPNNSYLDSWLKRTRIKLLSQKILDFDLEVAERIELVDLLAFGYAGLPLELRKRLIRVHSATRQQILEARTKDSLDKIRDQSFEVQATQRFRSGIVLPNEELLWFWGMSLSVYTDTSGPTILGKKIHDYKYEKINAKERRAIEEFLTDVTQQFILFRLVKLFPEQPPFDLCLGVPPNNPQGISICHEIGQGLVRKNPNWLKDGFSVVRRTSSIAALKRKSKAEKQALLTGLYSVDTSSRLKPSRGILLLDDIFQTGSSVRELCKTLKITWPETPIFVITLTHLKETEMALL